MVLFYVFIVALHAYNTYANAIQPSSKLDTMLQLAIDKQWDSRPTGHAPVQLKLTWSPGHDFIKLTVDSPYFNDPTSPDGPVGKPFPKLWDYEVAEIFFLGKDDKYLEVEVGPHGQHLLLLLNGTRNMIKDELPLKYTASIDSTINTWYGEADIPLAYLPYGCDRMNAYAIHGSGEARMYESLYPAQTGQYDNPDFHRLGLFQSFDLQALVKDTSEVGKYWDNL